MALHRLPNVKDSQREASEWIARLNSDDVSAEDVARFEAWKRVHPVNADAFQKLLRTWKRFERAGPLVRAVAFGQSMGRSAASRRPRPWRFALAATVVIATVLAGLYLQRSPVPRIFRTAVGEQATVSLPDGSSMALNSNSIARIEYSPRRRIIHLEQGEAFFSVAHDMNRPFWVTSGPCWVRAVGTQFDVYRKVSGLQVTVSEGSIRVGGNQRLLSTVRADETQMPIFATLSAGQQADVLAASATMRELSAEDLNQAVAWRSGTLYFANRPLADVVTELNRYTSQPIILEDDRLRSLPVGGTFHASPQGAETLLRLLEQSFNVQVQRSGTQAVVRGGPNL